MAALLVLSWFWLARWPSMWSLTIFPPASLSSSAGSPSWSTPNVYQVTLSASQDQHQPLKGAGFQLLALVLNSPFYQSSGPTPTIINLKLKHQNLFNSCWSTNFLGVCEGQTKRQKDTFIFLITNKDDLDRQFLFDKQFLFNIDLQQKWITNIRLVTES